ncbi:hypothetical protein EZV62_021446 [Acer yangbiense]|uniref:Uncharacterized protein n=1 Tax=Acer yangbiense TaxID=1000413 RepID=A0A5C7H5Q1_9ROSI|nr:hypothetical protein EZV62_021446 [Acer yangbiense]
MKTLRSCDLYPDVGIENLIEKSLVTISNDTLEMHDLIQEMAFAITREHNHREPGKWSRLWRVKEVSYVLTENKGTEAIEAIILNMPEQGLDSIMQGMPEQGISGKSFTTMKNLRLLKISNVRFSDDHLEYLSNELWLLKWRGYPLKTLPSSFQPKNLFKLDMCYSHVEFLWGDKKHLEKLKTIKLSNSCNLIETPDFTNITNLEKLELERCTKLRRIHPSIGSLKRLRVLRLNNCNLSEGIIPNDLGSLISLEELYLSGNNFVSLPESISELPKLKHLCLNECHRLRRLPKIPPDIHFLLAEDCTSLETISSAKKQSTSSRNMLYFLNCCKLTENQGTKDNLAVTLLKQRLQDLSHHSYQFDICLPGTKIPEWFSHCNNIGSSVGIGLRDNWLNDDFIGFAVCIVFDHNWGYGRRIECSIWSQASRTDFSFRIPTFTTAKSDHLWLGYLSREILKELLVDKCVHAHFEIYGGSDMFPHYSVKRASLVGRVGLRPYAGLDLACLWARRPSLFGGRAGWAWSIEHDPFYLH